MTKSEAIERLRQLYSDTNAENKAALECLIPELKESEDERIMKAIESIIRVYGKTQGEWIAGYDMDTLVVHLRDAFACFEKQKEQQFTHHEVDESLRDAVTHQMEDDGDVDDFIRKGIDDIALKYAELGAKWQKEQLSTPDDIAAAYQMGLAEGRREQKPELCDMGRWDDESYNNGIHHVLQNPEAYGLTKQKPAETKEEQQ